jgi:hypothetical protein
MSPAPQHRGLADARAAHDEDRLPALDEVLDDLDRAEDGPADAAGEADGLAAPVADGADSVERALDAGAVVLAERADVVHDVLDVTVDDLALEQDLLPAAPEARLRTAAQVHDHLDEIPIGGQLLDGGDDLGRERGEECVEVVGHLPTLDAGHGFSFPARRGRHHRTAGTMTGSATRTSVSFMSSVTVAMRSNPASSSRPSTGAS